MRKIYLDGLLGDKFGHEWNLAVNTVGEAISAISCQRRGFREHLLADTAGYEVIFDKEDGLQQVEELCINLPAEQSFRIVPVVSGKKSGGLFMVVAGIALIAATGGFAAFGLAGAGGSTAAAAGAVGTQAGATITATAAGGTLAGGAFTVGSGGMTIAQAAAYHGVGTASVLGFSAAANLGTGLVLAGVSTMLAPKVKDGGAGAKQAENYLFNGAINNAKQGSPIPLVYGRSIVGSTVIGASLFTTTSRFKVNRNRKLIGIRDFRTPGSRYGTDTAGAGSYNGGSGGSGGNGRNQPYLENSDK